MRQIAVWLANAGVTLYSGGANGADLAFQAGCDSVGGPKKIFLPWKDFNGSGSPYYEIPPEAFEIAKYIHPAWNNCSNEAKFLHARNVQQVLGKDLDNPVKQVICWTRRGKSVGGTRTAIILAQELDIRVFNLYKPDVREYFERKLKEVANV